MASNLILSQLETPSRARGRSRWLRLRIVPGLPLAILAVVVLTALFAPLLAPHSATKGRLNDSFAPPVWQSGGSASHLLGTDATGRDELSRMIYGARVPLEVVIVGVLATATIGTVVGLVAGYFGGLVDVVLMRLVDTVLAIPPILLAIALIGALGASLRNVLLVICMTSWAGYARVLRAEALRVRSADHIALARVAGCGTLRILAIHVFPEVLNTLLVLSTLSIAGLILYEAGLSFLGLGVRPPAASWGTMINEGRAYLQSAWWLTVEPGVALLLTCVSANLLGDWIRDRLDPRLRNAGEAR